MLPKMKAALPKSTIYLSAAGRQFTPYKQDPNYEGFLSDNVEVRFHLHYREEHIEHRPYVEVYNNHNLIFTQVLKTDALTVEEKNTVLKDVFENILRITMDYNTLLEDLGIIDTSDPYRWDD